MKSNTALNAWADINSLLKTHKLINLGLILICIFQLSIIGMMYLSDPIVIVKNNEGDQYYRGLRDKVTISEKSVEIFIKDFLRRRYEWAKLDPSDKKKSLAPIVTKGLNQKVYKHLSYLNNKEFQGKRTQQSIVNIEVNVTKNKVVASFDKLLKIEGIPIPIPTTLSLNIIKEKENALNPIGLYVNGIKEHQSK
jgi:hypothetical protein